MEPSDIHNSTKDYVFWHMHSESPFREHSILHLSSVGLIALYTIFLRSREVGSNIDAPMARIYVFHKLGFMHG